MAIISLVRRGSVILRGISLLGYVLCSQQSTVINPDEFVDYSLELLVEPVRGANSSTERHNIAAHTQLQMIIGGLDQVLCAMYTHRPNPDADVLPLDRRHNGGEGGDQVQQESNLNFNFLQNGGRRQVSEVIQIVSKCKSSNCSEIKKKRSVTPCPRKTSSARASPCTCSTTTPRWPGRVE